MLVTADPLFWEDLLLRPLAERRGSAPRELIDFIGRHNQATGNGAAARAAVADPALDADIDAALAKLPLPVLRHLAPCLLGVFVMDGVGASAASSVVTGPEGEMIGAFVAIDATAFAGITANAWFERRENMPFRAAAGMRLEARIADDAHDDRVGALQFVLLHEFGHVLAACKSLAPMWWRAGDAGASSYPLLDLCWQATPDGRYTPRAGHDFPLRGQLVYHGGAARLTLRDAEEAYAALGRTGFPTLYAATSVHEDIADSFAAYVHVRLMGRPLEHRLHGTPVAAAPAMPYWDSPHGDARAALFEALLEAPPD